MDNIRNNMRRDDERDILCVTVNKYLKKEGESKMKQFVKVKKTIVIAILLLFSMTTSVFAEEAWITRTAYNHSYDFRSVIAPISGGFHIATEVRTYDSVPAGYMEAIARIFNANGQMLKNERRSNGSYESSVTAYFEYYTYSGARCYSKGKVNLYNGNGYDAHYCTQTPTLQPASYVTTQVQVNDNGEIYGSEYFLNQIGVQPDLISAVGENGLSGYVKESDLNPEFRTPEELLEFEEKNEMHIIPLYLEDGETVIGSFVID